MASMGKPSRLSRRGPGIREHAAGAKNHAPHKPTNKGIIMEQPIELRYQRAQRQFGALHDAQHIAQVADLCTELRLDPTDLAQLIGAASERLGARLTDAEIQRLAQAHGCTAASEQSEPTPEQIGIQMAKDRARLRRLKDNPKALAIVNYHRKRNGLPPLGKQKRRVAGGKL